VNNITNSITYPAAVAERAKNAPVTLTDTAKAARQVEEVFLNEMLKSMFQTTELAKDSGISDYLPFITSEVSKAISKRGVGIQEFLMKSPAFNLMVKQGNKNSLGGIAQSQAEAVKSSAQGAVLKAYGTGIK
jgi:Rod binding domain-containing protein